MKDSVNTVWWLSKSEGPKAAVRNVLAPYSEAGRILTDEESSRLRTEITELRNIIPRQQDAQRGRVNPGD